MSTAQSNIQYIIIILVGIIGILEKFLTHCFYFSFTSLTQSFSVSSILSLSQLYILYPIIFYTFIIVDGVWSFLTDCDKSNLICYFFFLCLKEI